MLKIIKYFKPFVPLLILAIVLLFAQAQADLALPTYMSDIVNIGIQQNGVTSEIPKIISEADMNKLALFLSEQELQLVKEHYDYQANISHFTFANQQVNTAQKSLYFLKDNVTHKEIKAPLIKALVAIGGINKSIKEAGGSDITFGDTTIPAGTDVFEMLKAMPAKKRHALFDKSKISAVDDKTLAQLAIVTIKNMYVDYGVDIAKVQRSYILNVGAKMVGISLLGALCIISVVFIAARIAAGVGKNLRTAIFTKIESFSNNEFDTFSTASLITRSTNDIMQIQNLLVIMIRMVFYAPILGIGGIISAVSSSPSMSWTIALAVIILIGIIGIIFTIAMPKFKIMQTYVDKLNLIVRQSLTGMMVIRAFNTKQYETEKFEHANEDLTQVNLFVNRMIIILPAVMMFIMNASMLLIVWVGADKIANNTLKVGSMIAFMQYALMIIMSFLMMSMMFILIPRASVSAGRIVEVLQTTPVVNDPSPSVVKPLNDNIVGDIVFDNVTFKYTGAREAALKGVSFVAKAGQTTAIIGSTGSGKTTLVNLIPKFYNLSEGHIYIDDMDINLLKLADIRSLIGYVPQKVNLFSGTIASNLRYGDEKATDEALYSALEIAQAKDFVDAMPEGLASEVSQGGQNFSGGQKQRLSIARALVKQPHIYIFDDSFSALDFKTDKALRKALSEHTNQATRIIVAQRISTIKNADKILVLEDGKLVGNGKHEDLMATCEIYREIAYSQLTEEELS